MENINRFIRKYNNKYYFCGKEVSRYGQEHGFLDYKTLAEAVGNMILNNDIINFEIDYWETFSGTIYELDEEGQETELYKDIFQYFIIDSDGAELLQEAGELVLYNNRLDVYLWCIDHLGTAWDYVLTDIKLEEGDDN